MVRRRSRFASRSETAGALLLALALAAVGVSCRGSGGGAPHAKELRLAFEARGFAAQARAEFEACSQSSLSCPCTQKLATLALDAGLPRAASDFLARADATCAAELAVRGLMAEALAYSDRPDDAEQKAASVLEALPEEKHALLARARTAFARGSMGESFVLAERASTAGRGAPAELLRGEIGERLGRYRDAREAYLRAVASPLSGREARFRLTLLTARAGARAEAEHHLQKLTALGGVEEARMKHARSLVAASAPAPSAVTATER